MNAFSLRQNNSKAKRSYDKMPIDWVEGRMGIYLAVGQDVRTWRNLAKYFPVRPFLSVSKYILFYPIYQVTSEEGIKEFANPMYADFSEAKKRNLKVCYVINKAIAVHQVPPGSR